MSPDPVGYDALPGDTARVARATFAEGNAYRRTSAAPGPLGHNPSFAALFSARAGRGGARPADAQHDQAIRGGSLRPPGGRGGARPVVRMPWGPPRPRTGGLDSRMGK